MDTAWTCCMINDRDGIEDGIGTHKRGHSSQEGLNASSSVPRGQTTSASMRFMKELL